MLPKVEKDTSTGVTMNPSIQDEVVCDMNVHPATIDPTPKFQSLLQLRRLLFFILK